LDTLSRRFRGGRIVARSFAIWGRDLLLLLALGAVVQAPRVACVEALGLAVPDPPRYERSSDGQWNAESYLGRVESWLRRAVPIGLASSLLGKFFRDLCIAVVVFAVYARLRGERAAFGKSVAGGLGRLFPVLRVSLCLFLLRAVPYAAWWSVGYYTLRHQPTLVSVRLMTLPIAPLVALLLSPLWVAVPAAVIERSGGYLRRSWRLTRGHRLAIGGIVLLLYAIDWGSTRLLRLGLSSLDLPRLVLRSIGWTQDLLVVSLAAVFAAVVYHALRLEKEGVDVSELEQVFA